MKRMVLCAQANEMDLVDYLQGLGHQPQQIRGWDYWYLSPLRVEKKASFKFDRKRNIWYDHGIGMGGHLVDFGILFYDCSVRDFLQKLAEKKDLSFSFHPPLSPSSTAPLSKEKRLLVTAVNPIESARFLDYLSKRNIDPAVAKQYLREVRFTLYEKEFKALGFRNNSGGFELRSEHFKGSSSPKDVTLIEHPAAQHLAVFEGSFSFLSYLCLERNSTPDVRMRLPEGHTSFLVLNTLAFLQKSRTIMESYPSVWLYLDRDAAGIKAMQLACSWSRKYRDHSGLYKGYKDLNEFLIHYQNPRLKKSLQKGMHL